MRLNWLLHNVYRRVALRLETAFELPVLWIVDKETDPQGCTRAVSLRAYKFWDT